MPVTRLFVSDDEGIVAKIRTNGKECILDRDLSGIASGTKVIAVSAVNASALAWSIVNRGVHRADVSYIEVGEDGASSAVRHLRWTESRRLRDAEDVTQPMYKTGIGGLDKNLLWRWRLNELVIVAGPYGSGKSMVAQILGTHFVHGAGRECNAGALFCSWEDDPANMRRNVGLFSKHHGVDDLLDRIHFVPRNASDDRLMAWFYDLVEYNVERFGIRFVVLDPWNEMDHVRAAHISETEYVRDMMKVSRRLVDEHGIILLIVTHIPAGFIKGDGSIEPFKIAHSFGSSQFGNKADRGICVVRSMTWDKTSGHAIIRSDKVKVQETMGRKGTVAFRYDANTFDLEYDGHVTDEVQNIWKD